MDDDPEVFWEQMLSRDADQIRVAWRNLAGDQQLAVYTHLRRMVSEEGWTEPQRLSARVALDALRIDDELPPE